MERNCSKKCLICYNNIKQFDSFSFDSHSQINSSKVSSLSSSSPLLNQHLHVIFILKTIFHLSSTQLTSYLKKCPNIEDWITICQTCEELIISCKSIYSEFLQAQEKLLAARLNIIKLVKASYNQSEKNQHQFTSNPSFSITIDCRRFINNHACTEIPANLFTRGDATALNKLINDLSPAFNQDIIVKEEPQEDIKTEDDPVYENYELEFTPVADEDDEDAEDWQPPDSPLSSPPLSLNSSSSSNSFKDGPPPPSRRRPKPLQMFRKPGSKKSKYQCPICHQILPGPSSLHLHKAIRHNLGFIKRHPCTSPNCRKCFASAHKLNLHKTTNHNSQPNKPSILNKKDSSNRKSSKSLDLDPISSLQFRCLYCHNPFPTKDALTTHKLQDHNLPQRKKQPRGAPKPNYSCTHCPSLKFKTLKHLRNHTYFNHTSNPSSLKEDPLQCKLCPNKYTLIWNLRRHLRTVHNVEPNPETGFKCPLCPRRFTIHGKLRNHCRQAHQVELDVPEIAKSSCEFCGGVFKNKSCWAAHMSRSASCKKNYRGETAVEEAICDQCGGKFANRYILMSHVKTVHEKKYKINCEHCASGFVQMSKYKKHLFNKHGIGSEEEINGMFKRWVCEEVECGGERRFRLKKELGSHMDWHRGTPSYTCDECGKQFYFETRMKIHIKNVHVNKNMFKCEVCGNGFKKEEKLILHLNTWHNKKGRKLKNTGNKSKKKNKKAEKIEENIF